MSDLVHHLSADPQLPHPTPTSAFVPNLSGAPGPAWAGCGGADLDGSGRTKKSPGHPKMTEAKSVTR